MKNFLKSIFLMSGMKSFIILGVLLVFTLTSYGSSDMGHVTGKVTIFQKKLFGKLKKKKDMSGVVVYNACFKNVAPEAIPDIVRNDKKFSLAILPVVVGQRVRFPNQDNIYYNVFTYPL